MCAGEKEEGKELTAYSTQGAAAADGRDLEEGRPPKEDTPVSQSEQQDQPPDLQNFGQGNNGPDMKTVSLSQVDAMTLRDFEVRATPQDMRLDPHLQLQHTCALLPQAAAA